MKCLRNDIILMRQRNLSGPFFQKSGGDCVKALGNYFAPGLPGSGPQAIRGEVFLGGEPSFVRIFFSEPINITCGVGAPWGMSVTVDDPARNLQIVNFITLAPHDVLQVELDDPVNNTGIEPGDVVLWSYDASDDCLVSRDEGEPLPNQGPINCVNNLVLEGGFMLLETGGKDIILVEDDTDDTAGIQVEDA